MSVAEKTEQKQGGSGAPVSGPVSGKTQKSGGLGETFSVIAQALILAVVIRTLFFQPFSIPSGSMRPTLLEGDYLFVTKWAYGYSRYSMPFSPNLFSGRIWGGEPERGDVVVFKFPPNPSVDYIKRVIGLPGDKVQVRDGQVFINDQPVKREKVGQVSDRDVTGETVDGPVDVYRETLPNGVTYNTLDLTPVGQADNTSVYTVPAGQYFMMGDNRDNSTDSRFPGPMGVGFVPYENLVGRANIIFFSIAGRASPLEVWRWPTELRPTRFFNVIR